MSGVACRLVGRDDAPDVVQEGFLSAYRNLASFRHESRFGTWLFRIVTNAALMHRRARTRRPVESQEAFLSEIDATGRHRHTPPEPAQRPCQTGARLPRNASMPSDASSSSMLQAMTSLVTS
jgi:RNA polymerase sigma factor (sigma-70 family)